MATKRNFINLYRAKSRRKLKKSIIKVVEFINYIPQSYKIYKRDRQIENKKGTFVNGSHYAKFRRFVYERHCKMYNTDYNAVVIDWDLFGEFCEKKEIARSIVKKVKHISVKSTYDPILNQRLVFK